MLIDYVIECFLVLKIPFESAKMFPALAIKKKCFKNNLQLRVFSLECVKNGGREAKLEALGIFGVVGEVFFFNYNSAAIQIFACCLYL